MKCSGKSFISFIRSRDLFAHQAFLRYKGEEDYGTVAGGLVSIAIYAFFLYVLVAKMGDRAIRPMQIQINTNVTSPTFFAINKSRDNNPEMFFIAKIND